MLVLCSQVYYKVSRPKLALSMHTHYMKYNLSGEANTILIPYRKRKVKLKLNTLIAKIADAKISFAKC